jgi:hypothetical protein
MRWSVLVQAERLMLSAKIPASQRMLIRLLLDPLLLHNYGVSLVTDMVAILVVVPDAI